MGLAFNIRFNKTPFPAEMVEAVNEKPKTVEPDAEIINPLSVASPPLALFIVAPSTSN